MNILESSLGNLLRLNLGILRAPLTSTPFCGRQAGRILGPRIVTELVQHRDARAMGLLRTAPARRARTSKAATNAVVVVASDGVPARTYGAGLGEQEYGGGLSAYVGGWGLSAGHRWSTMSGRTHGGER